MIETHPQLTPGDTISVRHRHHGEIEFRERSALVLERPHRSAWPCRVRWHDTGLEELLYPRADLVIERAANLVGRVTTS